MTRAQMLLASRFLDLASEYYSNNSCNDVDPEMFESISNNEKRYLMADIRQMGSMDEESTYVPDWLWMKYLSNVLKKESQ